MPFLFKETYAFPGMLISCFTLVIVVLTTYVSVNNLSSFFAIPVILICFFAFIIYHYWQQNLTRTYLDKLSERNLESLTQTISKQSKEIDELKEENARLSKIIHKDNKLIPALEYAVFTYLNNNSISENDRISKGSQLVEELTKLSHDRKGILRQQNIQCQKLTPTNLLSLDNLLSYMQQKALKHDIELQTHITCDMLYFAKHIMNEEDLKTLIADLLENALIATTHNKGRYILLNISIVSEIYTISVFDSGIPFTTDVLKKWGLEQKTTHENDGGSGIGMMTTYELLKKYNASFIIHELTTDNQTFTKEVSVSFNKRNQYILQTNRPEEALESLSSRADLHIIRQ